MFWAIFPRRDRKPEARLEWKRAKRTFGTERIILTAAKYCAQMRGKPHTEILPAVAWLATLTEPEPQPGIFGLDLEKLGSALLTVTVTARQLGHSSCTSQDRWLLLRDLLDSLYKIALTDHKTV
jgi:hypothetical protein